VKPVSEYFSCPKTLIENETNTNEKNKNRKKGAKPI
jgi:hypothetical protein